MRPYRPVLHTLAAISCPLLGLLFPGTSIAVASGLWFMAKVAGDRALQQLAFQDRPIDDTEEGGPYVWRLNGPGAFPRFRHVILVGSQQDKYIPLYSSHPAAAKPPPGRPARARAHTDGRTR